MKVVWCFSASDFLFIPLQKKVMSTAKKKPTSGKKRLIHAKKGLIKINVRYNAKGKPRKKGWK